MRGEFDLANLLNFDPQHGRILLQDYRMVMFSACALGALRKELIESLGWKRARGLMKRFGYAAGLADGKALSERFPAASRNEQQWLGAGLHSLEGVAQVVRVQERSRVDLDLGIFQVEGRWLDSYEAEQHLAIFGQAHEPVCWNLTGYATGHSTFAAGKATLVIEKECKAMGYDHCRFEAAFDSSFSSFYDIEREDYAALCLPELLDQLRGTIEQQQRELASKDKTIVHLNHRIGGFQSFGGMVGTSEALGKAVETARRVAPVDATALILGESGTGKELLARGIHENSLRAGKAFVAVNCSALPESMQESELFGHAKGAFTGAASARPGLFESADGGTIFLDEIGDLNTAAQTKILRVLQEREVKRLGENQARKVDVRVIAATHRDLKAMVADGSFRHDLFYRLDVVTLQLPPLRERENDALLLADHFLKIYAEKFSRDISAIAPEARQMIAGYNWPGNVRELQNAMERAVILADQHRIEGHHLPEGLRRVQPYAAPESGEGTDESQRFRLWRRELLEIENEEARIRRALQLTNGNKGVAARLLGLGRTTLWRRMKQFAMVESD